MAAFLRVLLTWWRRGRFAYKMAAMMGVCPVNGTSSASRSLSNGCDVTAGWQYIVTLRWRQPGGHLTDDARELVGHAKYDDPRLKMSHEGAAHERLCVICFVVWPTRFAYKMAAFLRVLPTSRRRQTKRKQKQRRIYSTSAFSERDTTVIVKRVWRHRRVTRDNAQRHVTAFRPISEAARNWSYDKISYQIDGVRRQ